MTLKLTEYNTTKIKKYGIRNTKIYIYICLKISKKVMVIGWLLHSTVVFRPYIVGHKSMFNSKIDSETSNIATIFLTQGKECGSGKVTMVKNMSYPTEHHGSQKVCRLVR